MDRKRRQEYILKEEKMEILNFIRKMEKFLKKLVLTWGPRMVFLQSTSKMEELNNV